MARRLAIWGGWLLLAGMPAACSQEPAPHAQRHEDAPPDGPVIRALFRSKGNWVLVPYRAPDRSSETLPPGCLDPLLIEVASGKARAISHAEAQARVRGMWLVGATRGGCQRPLLKER